MTKKIKTSVLVTLVGLTLFSFTTAITGVDFTVLTSKSSVKWTGYKPGGQHQGNG